MLVELQCRVVQVDQFSKAVNHSGVVAPPKRLANEMKTHAGEPAGQINNQGAGKGHGLASRTAFTHFLRDGVVFGHNPLDILDGRLAAVNEV